ncbi:hypothetical protein QS257_08000 [Terrilactibacillus sp. S3-3]|nr:hypothetical protein QS257_08000 [Terrilactibacillus sp. S3-3]
MALEPDITIEENRHYVTIKGCLRLTGEYKPLEQEKSDFKNEEIFAFRTVDEITETDIGTAVIEHRFPVDITVPSYRIRDLEDVFVIIESFDYELTEKRQIQLQADVAITGLTEQQYEGTYEKKVEAPLPEVPANERTQADACSGSHK